MASSSHPSPFHTGERAAQERAGVAAQAQRVAAIYHSRLPPPAREFLFGNRLLAITAIDARGWPVGRLASGHGLVEAEADDRLRLAMPAPGSLTEALRLRPEIGLLIMDPTTRRRMRINGRATLRADDGITIETEAVYSNCPRYIRPRRPPDGTSVSAPTLQVADRVDGEVRALIESTDTYFLHTAHPDAGADASHRGGTIGDLRLDGERLLFPDYAGNNLLNSFGNLVVEPRLTVTVPDFHTGDVLAVRGRAMIHWRGATVASFPDAARAVEVKIHDVAWIRGALPSGWSYDPRSS